MPLTPVAEAMLVIKSLDSEAVLEFSEYTNKWYVSARLDVGDGYFLSGGTEHREDPRSAVLAYLERLKAVKHPEYIAMNRVGQPRHEYRWNGAAFVDVTRPEVKDKT